MSGFENDIMFAKNADFTQADNQSVLEANGLATNGQLWVGTTALNAGGTHVNVGSITSPGGTLTVGYSSPNITLDVAAAGASYAFTLNGSSTLNPVDSTTYYVLPNSSAWQTTAQQQSRFYVPKTGTLRQVFGVITASTPGSAENVTVAIRLNDTTNTNVTTTLQLTANSNAFSNSALAIAVTAGDFIQFMVITPTWVTNPLICNFMASAFVS